MKFMQAMTCVTARTGNRLCYFYIYLRKATDAKHTKQQLQNLLFEKLILGF